MGEQDFNKAQIRRFENESSRAQRLASERPKHWQCLLAIELLRSKLAPINKKFDDLQKDQAFKPSNRVSEKEVINWLICKAEDLRNLIPHLGGAICNDLIPSTNEDGKSGNPILILEAVEKICEAGRQLLVWEEEMRFTLLPSQFGPIQKTLRGMTSQSLDELNSVANKLEAPFKKKNPAGNYKLKIVFKDPPNTAKLSKQLSALLRDMEKNPQNWIRQS
jgi:hypothetical protein